MPDQFDRKAKLSSLHDWLSELDPVTDEDYARKYLKGEKQEDQEINSEHSPEIQDQGNQMPDDDQTSSMDDEALMKRLNAAAAEADREANSISTEGSAGQPQSQPAPRSEPDTSISASRMAARLNQPEIEEPDFNQLRGTAIEEYETDFQEKLEVDRSAKTRLKKWFDQLPPNRRVDILLVSLIAVALVVLLVVFRVSQTPQVAVSTPTVFLDPSIPIPVMTVLPDGQSFYLAVGNPENGSWTPKAAEWLSGSEVPRWLSLPWNEQLESLVRAYKVDDPIQLQMSNKDTLVYRFQSIQEISAEEMGSFHANTPDLLIVLTKPGAATRLVIIAVQ